MLNWLKEIIRRINDYPKVEQDRDTYKQCWDKTKEEKDELYHDYLELATDNQELLTEYQKTLLPEATHSLIEYYDTKYQDKNITYNGLKIHLKDKVLLPSIKVCDFIHITESMRGWLRDNNLMYDGDNSEEDISKHMWKIYSKFTDFNKYQYDKDLYGENEKWISNFEQMYVRSGVKFLGDCENMANLCCGMILASGVPRGLVKVTCGKTNSGYGHATLTAWDWRTQQFEIWETTSNFPRVIERGHKYDFKNIWFSFDNEKSWTELNKTKYGGLKND